MVIGITGIVGSGKSTIVNYIKQKTNCVVIDTDSVAKELMQPGTKTYKDVIDFFGDSILETDNTINRKKLATIVFENSDLLDKLNEITHTNVINEVKRIINNVNNELIVIESALLFDTPLKELCDYCWVIIASYEEKKKRLMENRGYSVEKINSIINSQKSNEELINMSDVVIINDDLETAKKDVIKNLKKIKIFQKKYLTK